MPKSKPNCKSIATTYKTPIQTIIRQTKDSQQEHGFEACNNGTHGTIASGGAGSVNMTPNTWCPNNGKDNLGVIHTHPEDDIRRFVKGDNAVNAALDTSHYPSDADIQLFSEPTGDQWVCAIGVGHERPAMMACAPLESNETSKVWHERLTDYAKDVMDAQSPEESDAAVEAIRSLVKTSYPGCVINLDKEYGGTS